MVSKCFCSLNKFIISWLVTIAISTSSVCTGRGCQLFGQKNTANFSPACWKLMNSLSENDIFLLIFFLISLPQSPVDFKLHKSLPHQREPLYAVQWQKHKWKFPASHLNNVLPIIFCSIWDFGYFYTRTLQQTKMLKGVLLW